MPRLLFRKVKNAVWISHLDLMRLFQRAFKRADLSLKHTQGFNPRPSVSIALPLSVGMESDCELLDFDLEGEPVPMPEICRRLNQALVDGVEVLSVYDCGDKIGDLAYLHCQVNLEYDNGVPAGAEMGITQLFSRNDLIVPKRTKNGMQDQNIIPLIRRLETYQKDPHTLILDAVICCQNPTLNPMQMPLAINIYMPEFKPDFAGCRRIEIYNKMEKVFR